MMAGRRARYGITIAASLVLNATMALAQQAPVTVPTSTLPAGPVPQTLQEPDLMLQGTMNYRLGNYEEALDDLTRARIKDPRSSVAAYYLGATLTKMQQYQKALPQLMEAVALKPVAKEAYLELADVYFVLGRNEEALTALDVCEKEGIEPAQTAFLKGLVLEKKRAYAAATAAFDRSKTLDPRLGPTADFHIAAILQRQGKQTEARDLFLAVAVKDPESAIGQMAKQQADALSRRMSTGERFQAVVSTQLQWDSNVTLIPDNSTISNQSDKVAVLMLRAEYAASTLPDPYSLKFQYAFYQSVYEDLTAFNVQSHTLGIAPGYAFGDSSVQVPLSYNMTSVDGKSYLKALSLAPVYVFTPGEGRQAQASFRFQQKDYLSPVVNPDENRDATELGAALSWYWLFAQQKGFVNAKYEINQENATGRNWSYLGNKFSAGTLYPATDLLKLVLSFDAYLQAYDVDRKDTTLTLTVQALYKLTKNLDLQLQYLYMKDDSTVPVYAFSKNVIGMGLYAKF